MQTDHRLGFGVICPSPVEILNKKYKTLYSCESDTFSMPFWSWKAHNTADTADISKSSCGIKRH
jgi:hypothetical protein